MRSMPHAQKQKIRLGAPDRQPSIVKSRLQTKRLISHAEAEGLEHQTTTLTEIETAQNQAVDFARTEAENQAWDTRQITLYGAITAEKVEAVNSARLAAADTWQETFHRFCRTPPFTRPSITAQADTSAPIAYLLSDRDGDGVAETDGLPQTLAAGEALTARHGFSH